jgi:hypothetical protein
MQVMITADHGDQVLVRVDTMAVEQCVVELELENSVYRNLRGLDGITLTAARAQDLGRALILAAQIVEQAFAPKPQSAQA